MSDNIDPGIVQAACMVCFLFYMSLHFSNPLRNHPPRWCIASIFSPFSSLCPSVAR